MATITAPDTHDSVSSAASEAPLILDTDPPRTLGFRDQAAFWGNLGVSLLGFSGAGAVLAPAGYPQLSLVAAIVATVVGTLLGTAMVSVSGIPGARTGAPAMALLRGLFGTRLSYVPTVLNILQCIGWGTFELGVIALGAGALSHGSGPNWLYIVLAGALTTAMTLRPLGMLRLLRRYVTAAVGLAMLYFTFQLLRNGLSQPSGGSWRGFLPASDAAIAVAVSWVPLAADYTRHARTARAGFWGSLTGYGSTQVWCYTIGLLALNQTGGDPSKIFSTLLGIAGGWTFFAVLVIREVDQSFSNVYSTAMSLHNLLPRADRRLLCLATGSLITVLALTVDSSATTYQSFLYLIGSVFIPLFGVLAVDYFLGQGRTGWNLTQQAPTRWLMILPWALGFATYQLINPASVPGWAPLWTRLQDLIHVHPQVWTSASLFSFLISALAAAAVVTAERRAAAASIGADLR